MNIASKRIGKLLLGALFGVVMLAPFALPAYAAGDTDQGYVPLEPLPGQEKIDYNDLSSYLRFLFPILITIGALIGVTTFTVYGVIYMTSAASGQKSNAAERMKKSLLGLILLIGSVLILETINPALVNFDLKTNLNTYSSNVPDNYMQ